MTLSKETNFMLMPTNLTHFSDLESELTYIRIKWPIVIGQKPA